MATDAFLPKLDRPAADFTRTFDAGSGFFEAFADAFGGVLGGRPAAPLAGGRFGGLGLARTGFSRRPAVNFGGLGLSAPLGSRPSVRVSSGPLPGFSGGLAQAATPAAVGQVATVGGAWAALDAHNAEIQAAANARGVPANLLKAMINRESSGNWEANNRVHTGFRNQRMLPFVGIFESSAASWGLDFDSLIGNKAAQIDAMAVILAGLRARYGSWENAVKVYFGGEAALTPGGFTDELGMHSSYYGQQAITEWRELDRLSGVPPINYNASDPAAANRVVQEALKYQGVAYVWGAIPGKGQDPRQTGWDCSGFTYWLDQNYGDGSLPQGSHYQYDYAVRTGKLFTDRGALQPGDLVFFDTGSRAGGGAHLNPASHVAIYIGGGEMLHAANPESGTIVSRIDDPWYAGRFLGAMRMPWSGGAGVPAGGTTAYPAAAPFGSTAARYASYAYRTPAPTYRPWGY